jgi:hypothetical protein
VVRIHHHDVAATLLGPPNPRSIRGTNGLKSVAACANDSGISGVQKNPQAVGAGVLGHIPISEVQAKEVGVITFGELL